MKIVPLFPRIQMRTVQSGRSPRERTASTETGPGVTVQLRAKTEQTSDLSRDEAFILLGRTMAQLDQSDGSPPLQDIHAMSKDKAVNLLIQE